MCIYIYIYIYMYIYIYICVDGGPVSQQRASVRKRARRHALTNRVRLGSYLSVLTHACEKNNYRQTLG